MSSVWVSYSSISEYLRCPQAYYYGNIYRHPKTNNKITIMQPPLALGQAVHNVLESLSTLPTKERFKTPLLERYEAAWDQVTGKQGGFFDAHTEQRYKDRGLQMLKRVSQNPGPLARKAVKIRQDLPNYMLNRDQNIILCGKLDWLEYVEADDSIKILDFKTGKNREDEDSLQLPIYLLLAKNCQSRPVIGASYWYLQTDDQPESVELPDVAEAEVRVLEVANKIKLARQFEKFPCSSGEESCWACRDYLKVVDGKAEFVTTGLYNKDIYVIPYTAEQDSDIL